MSVLDTVGCYNKIPQAEELKQRGFISNSSEVLESGIKTPVNSVPNAGFLLSSWMAAFSSCPHVVERESSGMSSTYKDTNPIMGLHPHALV